MCDKEDATNKIYYHVTTQQNAEQIIKSGQLKNGKWESYVYAWTQQPTRKEASVAGIGKEATTVLKFKTKASLRSMWEMQIFRRLRIKLYKQLLYKDCQ